ncbi:MAG: hypothetical protein LBW85_04390 [Deltaproteobacteria bacterium]|nr:hypothetical protein [Deltaproteobacteria bacterium]
MAVLRGVKVTDAAPCRSGGDRHLNFRFTDGFRTFGMTGFNLAPRLAEVAPELDLAVIFDPEASRFGSWSPSWRLLDFKRPGQSPSPWASWRPAAVGEAAGGPAAPGAVSAKARKAAVGPEGAGPADAAPDGQAAGEGGAGAAGATAAPSGGPPAAGLLRRPQLPQGGAL